jgi:hypothetical protein
VVAGRKAYRLGLICGSMALLLASTAGGGLQRTGQWPQLPPDAVRVPDAVDQSKINEQNLDKQSFEVINAERKKQISNDSSQLLQLAIDLKAEVDKTSKDTLSVNVIRKADAIEKLAHNVKEKMKMSIGSN